VNWIYTAHDKIRRLTVERKLKNFRLSSSGYITLSRKNLLSILIAFLVSIQKGQYHWNMRNRSGNFAKKIFFQGKRISIYIMVNWEAAFAQWLRDCVTNL